jgi:hypothetical protein
MSLSMPFNAQANIPGSSAEKFPEQVTFLQGRVEKSQIYQGVIASTTVDAGNDPTSILRMGLLLGLNSSNELTQFDPSGGAGTQDLSMILALDLSMLNNTVAAKKFTGELYGGGVIDPNKIVLGSSSTVGIVGNAYEYHIRKLLTMGDFIMEDNLVEPPLFSYKRTVAKTAAAVTLTDGDRDIQYTNVGAAPDQVFTLPTTPKKDLAFYFYVSDDENLKVASAGAGEMIAQGNAAASSVEFETATKRVGGAMAVIGDGTKWKVHNISAGDNPLTVA